jgi:hypothetical protein
VTQLNCNDEVWVQLSDEGRSIFAAEQLRYPQHFRLRLEEVDGWSRWQLWRLMQVFGHRMYNGCTPPFVDNVIRLEAP